MRADGTVKPCRDPAHPRIEQVIAAAVNGDEAPFHAMLAAVTAPFAPRPRSALDRPPADEERVTQTFCGT